MTDTTEPNDPNVQTAQSTPDPTDWQAKFNEAVKHSRTWEERSKANLAQVQALTAEVEQLKTAAAQQPSEELAAANKRADEAEATIASMKHDAEVAQLRNEAAQKYGIPASLLNGETADDFKQAAEALTAWARSMPRIPALSHSIAEPQGTNRPKADPSTEAIRAALFGNKN